MHPLFLLVLASFALSLSGFAESQQPNILLIIADDLRTELGCYGSEIAVTPHIDSLAQGGLRFDRAYCQKAVCWPSRNSFLSGLMPASLGKTNSTLTFRASHPDIASLPQWFKQHGWESRGFGKILHNGQDDPQSWSEPHYDPPPNYYASPEHKGKVPVINKAVAENRVNPLVEAADAADDGYEDGWTAKVAAKAILGAKNSEQPFFYMVGFHKPHSPFNAPKKYWNYYERPSIPLSPIPNTPENAPSDYATHDWKYLRSFQGIPGSGPMAPDLAREVRHGYLACVSYVDELVGQLLAALDESGQRENTLILLWSDHGYHLGDHSMWSKHTVFEIATRVPLIVSGPGVAEGASTPALVELVDLYPTLADYCNLPLPSHLEGRSFASVFVDPESPARQAAFSEFNRQGAKATSVRAERYRYTEWRSLKNGELVARELYDHETDPLESRNVIGDASYEDAISHMAELLKQRLAE